MTFYKISNKRTGSIYAEKVIMATRLKERLIGLMFKDQMNSYDGLILAPCNSIHTCFMRFNIDAIFLDKNNKVIQLKRNLNPWRMTPIYLKARKVIELQAKSITRDLKIGDTIEVVCLN